MNVTVSRDVKIHTIEYENKVIVDFLEKAEDTYLEFEYNIPFPVTDEDYVFMPACAYNGNRFEVLKKKYPPLFSPEEARVDDMPETITDVPRLNKDGSGVLEVTTGDMAVPCVGVFSAKEKKAILFYTIQEIDGINLGIAYETGKITLSYPHMRKYSMYRWPFMVKSTDSGISFPEGKRIKISYKALEFECANLREFYHQFFETRKIMGMASDVKKILDDKKQFQVLCNKLNKYNWKEQGGFYGTENADTGNVCWQPGWVGGGMYTYALMRLGGPLEWERSMKTLEHLFRTQVESGFFYESTDVTGESKEGLFGYPWAEDWHVVRKAADILYYLFLHFELIKERGQTVPAEFEEGAKKLADAFVHLWEKHHQFGQIVSLKTGELVVGGTTSGAIAIGGLVYASEYFGKKRYLEVAEESAEFYYQKLEKEGYTLGGPAEILQGPDSESAFALLESLVTLYRFTKEEKWLDYCRYAAEFCSSWVVAYNYRFRDGSEFARLDMKTTGCVFANVQNKHAAPGICTLSGYSLYQLYQWTGEEKYLELFREITVSPGQYMPTEERPIYTWDVPKDAMLLENGPETKVERKKQPSGCICERVNMSDWETERCIGGVFPGSSIWCESAELLILADRDKYKA